MSCVHVSFRFISDKFEQVWDASGHTAANFPNDAAKLQQKRHRLFNPTALYKHTVLMAVAARLVIAGELEWVSQCGLCVDDLSQTWKRTVSQASRI